MTIKPNLNEDGSVPASWYDEAYWEAGAKSGKMSYNGNDYANNLEVCKYWAQDSYNRWGPFDRYLELGCGRGWAIWGFNHLNDLGVVAHGVDISHYAVETSLVKAQITEHDISDLSFIKDDSYDIVFSNDVLEHLTEKQILSCLFECKRVSKRKIVHLISIGDGVDLPDATLPDDQDQSHVTLKSKAWWEEKFRYVFQIRSKIDILDHGRTIEFAVTMED